MTDLPAASTNGFKSGSRLEKVLRAGHFAVTGELGPPQNADPEIIRKKARLLRGACDAANITDNQTAIVRMSSIGAGILALQEGLEPVIQMTCRDRNRLAMQSDILGAYALGLRNLLCLTGDHQQFGDHPASMNVFDLDSVQLIQTVKKMRDDGRLLGGQELKRRPQMFIGAAANPFNDPFEVTVLRLAKKVAAGAQFIQTQCIYNVEKFKVWMAMVRDRGLHDRVAILAGLTPLKSVGMARYMQNRVPGMDVPDDLVRRLAALPKDKQAAEGIAICVEHILELKEVEGLRGFHIMAIEWEEKAPEIVERAGLTPRPQV